MRTFIKLLLTALAVVLIASLLPGVSVTSYGNAIWVAIALAFLNTFIRPLLLLLTLPVTLVSMGFFVLCINACIILLASSLVDGFFVSGFLAAFFFSLLLWAVRSFLFSVFIED